MAPRRIDARVDVRFVGACGAASKAGKSSAFGCIEMRLLLRRGETEGFGEAGGFSATCKASLLRGSIALFFVLLVTVLARVLELLSSSGLVHDVILVTVL